MKRETKLPEIVQEKPSTLSRLLPLIIAVGKSSATFVTAARIWRSYQIKISKSSQLLFWTQNKKRLLTFSDMKALSGLSTIGERVPS